MRKIALAVAALLACASQSSAAFLLSISTIGPVGTARVTSSTGGIVCGNGSSACSASIAAGSTVTLTEVQGSTTVFAGWGVDGCRDNSSTCAVLMDAPKTVTARFNPVLSLRLSGNGLGSVSGSSNTISCNYFNGCAGGGAVTQSFLPGSVVILTASTGAFSSFTGWTGGGCSTASTCTVTVNSYTAVVATFTSAGPFTIKVSKGGDGLGTVTSSPAGISCGGVCSSTFTAGTPVTLTASTGTGSYFAGWANGGCSSTSTTCVVTSTSAQQGLGGTVSPAAFFYR